MEGYKYFPKPVAQAFYTKFGIWITQGVWDLEEKGSLNELFPEVKPMTVKEALASWKDKTNA